MDWQHILRSHMGSLGNLEHALLFIDLSLFFSLQTMQDGFSAWQHTPPDSVLSAARLQSLGYLEQIFFSRFLALQTRHAGLKLWQHTLESSSPAMKSSSMSESALGETGSRSESY